jgi:acyl dehydratase
VTERVVLPAVPGLAGLYARAVGVAARSTALARLGRAPSGLPDVEYAVDDVVADAGRLTAYQHLVGETASDALPAGFVHVLAFPVATALMVRDDFPLPPAGMVHLANQVEQERALRLGERLGIRAHATGLRPHRSGTQVDLVTEVRGDDDAVAWRGVSTYLAKGVRLQDAGAGAKDVAASARPAFVPPAPTGRWTLPVDEGRRYAAVSGDRNPIHLSALTARPLGFRRAIAHGMDTAARGLAAVGRGRGEAFTWTVEFARPVLLPGTVTVRVAPDDAGPGFRFTGWDARSGTLHLTGAVVPR